MIVLCGLLTLALAAGLGIGFYFGRIGVEGTDLQYSWFTAVHSANATYIEVKTTSIGLEIVALAVALPIGLMVGSAAFLYIKSAPPGQE